MLFKTPAGVSAIKASSVKLFLVFWVVFYQMAERNSPTGYQGKWRMTKV